MVAEARGQVECAEPFRCDSSIGSAFGRERTHRFEGKPGGGPVTWLVPLDHEDHSTTTTSSAAQSGGRSFQHRKPIGGERERDRLFAKYG